MGKHSLSNIFSIYFYRIEFRFMRPIEIASIDFQYLIHRLHKLVYLELMLIDVMK